MRGGTQGEVNRSTDGHVVHANCDTDVIVDEQPVEAGSSAKPEELYHIIEQLVQGRRRLELFGSQRNVRRGWVTLGRDLAESTFEPHQYAALFQVPTRPRTASTASRPRDSLQPSPALGDCQSSTSDLIRSWTHAGGGRHSHRRERGRGHAQQAVAGGHHTGDRTAAAALAQKSGGWRRAGSGGDDPGGRAGSGGDDPGGRGSGRGRQARRCLIDECLSVLQRTLIRSTAPHLPHRAVPLQLTWIATLIIGVGTRTPFVF